jgi:hypothetical protein
LDGGTTCEQVAKVFFLDANTIRSRREVLKERGIETLASFNGFVALAENRPNASEKPQQKQ